MPSFKQVFSTVQFRRLVSAATAKRFFKTSWDSLLLQSVILALLCLDVYACVVSTYGVATKIFGENGIGIFAMVVFYLGIPLLLYLEATFLLGPIRLETDRISTCGDKRIGREKIQYPASVEYADIAEVAIIPIRKNSRGGHAQLARPIPYLYIKTKRRKNVRFALHFMSAKSVRILLIDLRARCIDVGCDVKVEVDSLMADFSKARWATKE